jgi:hypothetical protein
MTSQYSSLVRHSKIGTFFPSLTFFPHDSVSVLHVIREVCSYNMWSRPRPRALCTSPFPNGHSGLILCPSYLKNIALGEVLMRASNQLSATNVRNGTSWLNITLLLAHNRITQIFFSDHRSWPWSGWRDRDPWLCEYFWSPCPLMAAALVFCPFSAYTHIQVLCATL